MDPRLNHSGPTLIVLAEHKPLVYDRSGLRLVASSPRRFDPETLDPRIHHANLLQSILAKTEANAAGADDALMLDRREFIAETNATNFCTGTMGELAGVIEIDGRRIGDARPGQLTARLSRLYGELTSRSGTPG